MILLIFWIILECIPKIYSTELCLTFTNSNLNPKSYFLAVVVEYDDSYYSTKYPIVSIHSADNMHRFPIESFYDSNNLIYPESPTFFDDKGIAFSIPNILGCFAPTCKCLFFSASGSNVMFWSSTNQNDNIFSEYVDIELNDTACGTTAFHNSYVKDNLYAVSDLANLSPSAVIWTMSNMNQKNTYIAIFLGTIIALSALILCGFVLFICVILRTPLKKPTNPYNTACGNQGTYSENNSNRDFTSSVVAGPVRRTPQSKSESVFSSSTKSHSHDIRYARSNRSEYLNYSHRDCDEISESSTSSYGSSRQDSLIYRDKSPNNLSRGYDRHPSSSSSRSRVKLQVVDYTSKKWSNNYNNTQQSHVLSNLQLPSQPDSQSRFGSPSHLQHNLPMHYTASSRAHCSSHIHGQTPVPTSTQKREDGQHSYSQSNNQSRHDHNHSKSQKDNNDSTHLNALQESPLLRRSPSSATFMSDPSIGSFLSDPNQCQNSTESRTEISASAYNRSKSHNNIYRCMNSSKNSLTHEERNCNESSSLPPTISQSTNTNNDLHSTHIHSTLSQESNQREEFRTLNNHSNSTWQPPPYNSPSSGFSPIHNSCDNRSSQAYIPPISQGHNEGYYHNCSPPKNRGNSPPTTSRSISRSDHFDCTLSTELDISRSPPKRPCISPGVNLDSSQDCSQGHSPVIIQGQSPGRRTHGSRKVTSRGYPVVRAGTKLSGLPTSRDRLATVRNWAIARENNQTKTHSLLQLQS